MHVGIRCGPWLAAAPWAEGGHRLRPHSVRSIDIGRPTDSGRARSGQSLPPTSIRGIRCHPPASGAFGATHQHRPFGATHQHRPFGATHQHRPFDATHQHRPFDATHQHRPFGATHQHPGRRTVGHPRSYAAFSATHPPTPGHSVPPAGIRGIRCHPPASGQARGGASEVVRRIQCHPPTDTGAFSATRR